MLMVLVLAHYQLNAITLSPLALYSQASMSPHQTMFPVFYDVLGLEIACWQIFSYAEIFLNQEKSQSSTF